MFFFFHLLWDLFQARKIREGVSVEQEDLSLFFFSSYNAVPISLMALLISLTAFNREHYLRQKLFQWKIKADNRVIFKATVRQDGVWQLQWIWHLQISQDLTDEANAVLIFGDS